MIGSIPSGYLLSQSYGKKDISKKGSKNIGSTNAYRVAGKYIGIATLVADVTKGIIPIFLAKNLFPNYHVDAVIMAGLLTVIGHIFPVWLKFNGGKGVATSFAVFLAIEPMLGLAAMTTFLIIYLVSRVVSVASLTAVLTTTLISSFTVDGKIAYLILVLSLLVFWRHKENIKRILEGKEKKI